ncbi:hypothetical protein IAR55_004007 [Kwoniella newhampshirensis]|uniref:BZIP domain-containing protein n=1 Tax=Kwoniella newhampshirensis TaxID=1651941 RepID=A0AAW0YYA4_9TREE
MEGFSFDFATPDNQISITLPIGAPGSDEPLHSGKFLGTTMTQSSWSSLVLEGGFSSSPWRADHSRNYLATPSSIDPKRLHQTPYTPAKPSPCPISRDGDGCTNMPCTALGLTTGIEEEDYGVEEAILEDTDVDETDSDTEFTGREKKLSSVTFASSLLQSAVAEDTDVIDKVADKDQLIEADIRPSPLVAISDLPMQAAGVSQSKGQEQDVLITDYKTPSVRKMLIDQKKKTKKKSRSVIKTGLLAGSPQRRKTALPPTPTSPVKIERGVKAFVNLKSAAKIDQRSKRGHIAPKSSAVDSDGSVYAPSPTPPMVTMRKQIKTGAKQKSDNNLVCQATTEGAFEEGSPPSKNVRSKKKRIGDGRRSQNQRAQMKYRGKVKKRNEKVTNFAVDLLRLCRTHLKKGVLMTKVRTLMGELMRDLTGEDLCDEAFAQSFSARVEE